MRELHLARDLLDKQLVDRENRPLGRVDGLMLELPADGPPRIVWLEVGAATLARRLGEKLANRVAKTERRWKVSAGNPLRISPEKVVHFGNDVQVDVEAPNTNAYAWERWLRARLIGRIPGANE